MSEPSSEGGSLSVFIEEPMLGVGLLMLLTTPVVNLFDAGMEIFGIPLVFIWAVGAFVVMGVPIYRLGRQAYPPPGED